MKKRNAIQVLISSLIAFQMLLFSVEPARGFQQNLFYHKSSAAYQAILTVESFGIGGVGYDSQITDGEYAVRTILKQPKAKDIFLKLIKEATFEGGLYALIGLRAIDKDAFEKGVQLYKAQKREPSKKEFMPVGAYTYEQLKPVDLVVTRGGCIINDENRFVVVDRIKAGYYDEIFKQHE